jgi:subtilisin-like proprotein convertase family protein
MCTLRDWDPEGGTLDWEMATLEVSSSAGPFTVEDISGSYEIGEQIEVIWDVAGTDAAPINCTEVDIYLSQDGGFSYPHLIAEGVPNSGKITLNAPEIPTGNAKIKVKASNNVFFNISGSTFRIRTPSEPTFTASYPAFFQNACLPNVVEYELTTSPILSFDEEIFVAEIQGLPATATWEAIPAAVSAGDNISLVIDYGDAEKQDLDLQVLLSSALQDTVGVEIQTAVITNDFSDLLPVEPSRNAESVSPVAGFRWETSEDALEYRIALSASPDFNVIDAEAIVSSDSVNFNSLIGYQLETGRTYFWRVYPINECGEGEGSVISAFRTGAVSCERYTAIDLPKSILPTSNAVTESVITVPTEGSVDAIEVRNLTGTHPFMGEIRARLESPAGTAVRLFTERCFNLSDFNVNFSDLAANEINCPLTGGNTYLPQDEFGILRGESTSGEWKLIIEDRTAGNGGSFQSWELELCGALVQAAPDFSKDTVYVSRGNEQFINDRNLQAEKSGVDPSRILYTVVDGPQNGVITHGTSTVTTGSQFTQWALDRWHLVYQHNGSQEDLDYITFTIEDEEGGWIGIDTLPIKVDEVLQTENVRQAKFELYPNPALGVFFIHPPKDFEAGNIQMFDSRGRLVREKAIEGQAIIRMHRQSLAAGVYYIQLENGKNSFTQKLILQ